MRRATSWLCGAAVLLAAGVPAFAGKWNKKLDVGDAAPAFADLEAVDGHTYSLADLAEKEAVVLVFTCNHCPVAQAHNGRFNEFVKRYEGKPVAFLAINVDQGESLDAMKTFVKDEELAYPYAYDESQTSGREYGATVTPHVFVLSKDRKVAYMGAWDDSPMNADKVKQTYAQDAVEAVLAGRTPDETETQQSGCGIHYAAAKREAK